MGWPSIWFIRAELLFCFVTISFSSVALLDTIRQSQSINDGKTLVSRGGRFELGFFSPGTSKHRYLGVWYNNIPVRTVVWVANRCNPITDSSGLLTINTTGNLVLLDQNKTVIWSTTLVRQPLNPSVQILDSGNLVLKEENEPQAYLWQSFDYPCDTLLPNMKLGWDLRSGRTWSLSAWKNPDDPCPGNFTYRIELGGPHTYPEGYIREGNRKFYRTGPWNGLRFSGSPELRYNPLYDFHFVHDENEVSYAYTLKNESMISRLTLNQTTSMCKRSIWIDTHQTWLQYSLVPRDYCDKYGLCGANGKCIIGQNPVCECLQGFKPTSQQNWNAMDWSQGCERELPLSCQNKHRDGFVRYAGLKLPDTTHTWVDNGLNLKECRVKCLNDCSCMAYMNSDIRGNGNGCVLWFGDLVDIRFIPGGGQDLYIRMPASEREIKRKTGAEIKLKTAELTVIVMGVVVSGMLILGYYICTRRKTTFVFIKRTTAVKEKIRINEIVSQNCPGGQKEGLELPIFDLSTIATATNNFSLENKLGEGGFGPVYRGMLECGQEIAVKRLSMSSGQGINEFKNELVILFAKLQHRNLVKLLGCCIHGDEKMLVYEYMPNRSLDSFIFDPKKSKQLEWRQRFQIICGVSRGLLYLHHDSRLRVIHRDLKASNILLDKEMDPKISDFGMARTFVGDQTEEYTNRVVGTYGYMAPEYAYDGRYSIKSDVFSFGVLMLEIISGKRSTGFQHQNKGVTLIGHAWTMMQEGRPSELIDACLSNSSQNLSEMLRCIQISLLCVQERPVDRPSMLSVIMMLASQVALVQPKPPAFFMESKRQWEHADYSSSKNLSSSTNDITITVLEAR